MKDDLISRSAAVELLRDKAQHYTVSMFLTSSECNVARVVATESAVEISNMPTVDAEPVRHGRWEQGKWATYPDGYVCDQCNTGYAIPYNYCPNCGAKMDAEAIE